MRKMMPSDSRDDAYAAIQQQADAWWARLRSGKATNSDATALRQWCAQSPEHARAWREVGHVWKALEPVVTKAVQRDPSLADAVQAKRAASVSTYRPERRAILGGAVAASAATMLALYPPLALWPSLTEFTADFRTGTGEQRQVALSDRLMVRMNTQTRINRHVSNVGEGIELVSGEAEILVSGRQAEAITVDAGGGRLLARSARFNVRYTGPEVCVTCLEGSVDMSLAGQQRRLDAGQQLIYGPRHLRASTPADPASAIAWRTGTLAFVDVPLTNVIDEINRYRRGRVILRNPELGQRRVRMNFLIRQTDNALAMIRELYGARMTELPGRIVLLT